MYRCDNCGELFHDPKPYHENHGEGMYEMFIGCPWCGGSFTEVRTCLACGEAYTELGDYCDTCKAEIDSMFNRFIENVANTFDLKRSDAVDMIEDSFGRVW